MFVGAPGSYAMRAAASYSTLLLPKHSYGSDGPRGSRIRPLNEYGPRRDSPARASAACGLIGEFKRSRNATCETNSVSKRV